MSSDSRRSSSMTRERSTVRRALERQYFAQCHDTFSHRTRRTTHIHRSASMPCRKWLPVLCVLFVGSVTGAQTFQDCPACSRMVAIEGGVFTMGSPENEPERKKFEGPRDNVKIASFAIGATEVTRGQYAVFVKETHRKPPANGCFKYGFSDVVDSNDADAAMDRNAS